MSKVKAHGEELRKEKLKEHEEYLKVIKKQVEQINQKYNYDPDTDTFDKKTLH